MFNKILVAIDETESSEAIFAKALVLAKAHQANLMIFHALHPMDLAYGYDPYLGVSQTTSQMFIEQWREREKVGLEKLRSLSDRAIDEGIMKAEFTQSIGDPGKLICTLAKTWNADLIVVGRRGLSGLNELLIGSVSNYVFHHTPCHLLTIQTEVQESDPS